MTALRPELPQLPRRFERLPVDARGYPVPWFVVWLDDDGETPRRRGEGRPDFRILYPGAISQAHNGRRCWLCGQTLGSFVAFNMGPMCTVNRTNGEPPSHRDCAEFAARACPFLTRPHARRRDVDVAGATKLPGIPLERNPGVAAVWVCKSYSVRPVDHGVLFTPGDPTEVLWFCEGRPASRAEVEASIESGLPSLRELAEEEGAGAVRALGQAVAVSRELIPA